MANVTTGNEDSDIANIIAEKIRAGIMSIVDIEIDGDFSDVLNYIQSNFDPEDVFDNGELDDWAIEHGYVKEEEK